MMEDRINYVQIYDFKNCSRVYRIKNRSIIHLKIWNLLKHISEDRVIEMLKCTWKIYAPPLWFKSAKFKEQARSIKERTQ